MKFTKFLNCVLILGSFLLAGCGTLENSDYDKNSTNRPSSTDSFVSSSSEVDSKYDKVAVTGITLDKTSLTLFVDESATLRETILPSNATNKGVTWTSSDSDIVSVGFYFCTIRAKSVGTATITATTSDGGFTASCEVVVKNRSVTGITLNRSAITLEEDQTFQLYEMIEPSNASDKTVHWTSENEAIATVDDTGRVTAIKKGTTKIVATTNDGGLTASCEVVVAEKAVYRYSLGETKAEIYAYKAIYGDESDYIRLVTPITNVGNRNIYCGSSTYDIEDSDGNVLQSIQSVNCEPEIIQPGETAYYYEDVEYTGSKKEGIKVTPHPTVKKADSDDCVRYDVNHLTFKKTDSSGLEALGKITNNTKNTTNWVTIAIHVFNKNDALVVTLKASNTKGISSGESMSFTASSLDMYRHADFDVDDIGRYEAFAYEWKIVI